ncbi:MAG: hypothetical protein ACOY3N_24030 [Bradyrhizobium sp.]|uniref:hypothetical protein n=1 Tax=Bradyrhizobium sp. TaxID=376 RepID=UPI003BF3A593
MSLSPALREALESYKKQIALAEDRMRRFETGEMSLGDLGPPRRDVTAEAIENEKQIISYFQRGIDIIEKLDSIPS